VGAECPTVECARAGQSVPAASPAWQAAARAHELKLAFVAGVQRFTRAQAGSLGDDGDELVTSLASMRQALGAWDSAIAELEKAHGRAADADAHVALATAYLDRHRIDEALRELGAAARLDDERADAYALQGLAFGVAGRTADAERALRRATALAPDDPAIAYSLAAPLIALGRSADATQALRTFTRIVTRRVAREAPRAGPVARFERIDLLRETSGIAPIFPRSSYADGYAALRRGEYAAALALLAEAVDRDRMRAGDRSVRAIVERGAAALRDGRLAAAIEALESAASAAPADWEAHRVLGLAYWVDDRAGPAIEQLRLAIRSNPGDERSRLALADVLFALGRPAEAERELQEAIAALPRSGRAHYLLGQLYQSQSLLPQAVAELQAADAWPPIVGRDRVYQTMGSLLVNQADFDGAVTAYGKRIDVNPNSAEAHRQLGEIYFLQGRHDEALAEFAAAAWIDPRDARAHAGAGQVHLRMGRHADAIDALRRALMLDSSLKEARYALATSLLRSGKADEGRRELEVFQRQQTEADAQGQKEFRLDAIRREASRSLTADAMDKAVELFQEAWREDPESARSHRDLALALLRAKRTGEAVEHLEAALRTEPTADVARTLAESYHALGRADDSARAVAIHQQLLQRARMDRIAALR
jgi:tetratricopeptide (TPR) repeat protein